jgi:hypothetical protein
MALHLKHFPYGRRIGGGFRFPTGPENRGPRPANRRGGRGGYGEITEHQNSFNILPTNPIIDMAEKVMAKVNSRTI